MSQLDPISELSSLTPDPISSQKPQSLHGAAAAGAGLATLLVHASRASGPPWDTYMSYVAPSIAASTGVLWIAAKKWYDEFERRKYAHDLLNRLIPQLDTMIESARQDGNSNLEAELTKLKSKLQLDYARSEARRAHSRLKGFIGMFKDQWL